jgi:hypothetical protein
MLEETRDLRASGSELAALLRAAPLERQSVAFEPFLAKLGREAPTLIRSLSAGDLDDGTGPAPLPTFAEPVADDPARTEWMPRGSPALRAVEQDSDNDSCLRRPRSHTISASSLAEALHLAGDPELPELVDCHCATVRAFVERPPSRSEARAYGYALQHAIIALPARTARACAPALVPNCSSRAGAAELDIWLGHADDFAALVGAWRGGSRSGGSGATREVLSVPAALELCARLLAPVPAAAAAGSDATADADADADTDADTDADADVDADACARGFVLFAHGSSGVSGQSLRIVRSLVGSGYVVLAPQSMANGRARSRPERASADAAAAAASDYWAFDPLYVPGTLAKGRLVYMSAVEDLVATPAKYHAIYSDVYKLRASEVAHALRSLPHRLRVESGVLLAGCSEGAMALARLPHDRCVPPVRVLGVALLAWACERCYYAPCSHQVLAAHSAPVLCAIGTRDPFFAAADSVAAKVGTALWSGAPPPAAVAAAAARGAAAAPVAAAGAAGAADAWRLTGSALGALEASAVPAAFVAQLESSWHDVTRSHDRCLAPLLAAFCADPHDAPNLLRRLGGSAAVRAREGSVRVSEGGRVVQAALRADDDTEPAPPPLAHAAALAAIASGASGGGGGGGGGGQQGVGPLVRGSTVHEAVGAHVHGAAKAGACACAPIVACPTQPALCGGGRVPSCASVPDLPRASLRQSSLGRSRLRASCQHDLAWPLAVLPLTVAEGGRGEQQCEPS